MFLIPFPGLYRPILILNKEGQGFKQEFVC